MAKMSRRARRKRKTRKKKRISPNKSSTPTPLGVDFGCFPANAAITFPEFSDHLREASIVAVAYGSEWSEALRTDIPSMSLVARRAEPLREAFKIFAAWSAAADGDAVELTVVLKETGGFLLGISPEPGRLARRCMGFDRTTVSPLTYAHVWCHSIRTVHRHLSQLRSYAQKPIAPFLFGGVTLAGLLTHSDPDAPEVAAVPGLTSILKFQITFADETDVEPGGTAEMLLRIASPDHQSAESGSSLQTRRTIVDIGSERARVLRTHFPITLERLHRSGRLQHLRTTVAPDADVGLWQFEQAYCNLALSTGSGWGIHYRRLRSENGRDEILHAIGERYEIADGHPFHDFTDDQVRMQLVADGRALLRYLDEPAEGSMSTVQARLVALEAIQAPAVLGARTGRMNEDQR